MTDIKSLVSAAAFNFGSPRHAPTRFSTTDREGAISGPASPRAERSLGRTCRSFQLELPDFHEVGHVQLRQQLLDHHANRAGGDPEVIVVRHEQHVARA